MANERIDNESARGPSGLEQCPVCMETFVTGLRLQPVCRHPCCLGCLQRIVNDQLPDERRCPQCREDFTHLANQLDDLPTTNYFDDLFSSTRDCNALYWPEINLIDEPVRCEWCPDEEVQSAEWHCYQCCQFLCANCFDRHKKGRCTKDHAAESVETILQVRVAHDNFFHNTHM